MSIPEHFFLVQPKLESTETCFVVVASELLYHLKTLHPKPETMYHIGKNSTFRFQGFGSRA